jgi:succinate-semialdehyde dehydrogenase/glutarate-semialdehyde dehydrogenase
MGDPWAESTTLAPLARADLRDALHAQVAQSIKEGARCMTGGEVPPGKGAFYPATILVDVEPGMTAFDEELFGPVAAIICARTEAEAIELANASDYGLGGGIFTRDLEKGERLARDAMESGSCFVNQYVRSDVRLPFGGVKNSGYGRELSSFGIREFVNIKAISIA